MNEDLKELAEFLHDELKELRSEYKVSKDHEKAFKKGALEDNKEIINRLSYLETVIASEAIGYDVKDADYKYLLFIVDDRLESYNDMLTTLVKMKVITSENVISKCEQKIDYYDQLHKYLVNKLRNE